MAEYDELYLVKNPFFLGSFEKAISECESLVIEETDIESLEKKTFYLVRTYLSLADWNKAEATLKKHLESTKYEQADKDHFEKTVRTFIEFIKSGVIFPLNDRNMMMTL